MRMRIFLILVCAAMGHAERCDPPAPIADFVRTLPDRNPDRRDAIEQRLNSDPESFWLNMLCLESGGYEKRAVREKYQKQFEAHPGNLDDEYLYGRSLVAFDTPAALRVFGRILAQDPDHPWTHNALLWIYSSPAFRDREKLRLSFETATRVCPSWTEPYRYLSAMDDDAMTKAAARLRVTLEGSVGARVLTLYSNLWTAEFKTRPKDEELRRVAADLKRLREMDGPHATIANGAKLIGDEALTKEMAPPRNPDVLSEKRDWRKSHPYPAPNDPPEKRHAYAEAQLEASAKWIAMEPERIAGYNDRFNALVILDAPAGQIARAGDDLVRIARTDSRAEGFGFIADVARTYVDKGTLLDRVPALIEEVLKGFDDPEAATKIDLGFDPGNALFEQKRMYDVQHHVGAIVTLSQYYEKLGQLEKARGVLAPLPDYLAKNAVAAKAPDANLAPNWPFYHASAHFLYLKRSAELDDRQGKTEGALTEYRQALLYWDGLREDLLTKQRKLWKQLGRSDEAWQAWVDSIPAPAWERKNKQREPGFVAVRRELPKVTLKDLNGVEWPVERISSKTTIAIVWATWCAPCVAELPDVVKLADKLKDRADVQVISLNTDENVETARAFVEKRGYKFAVLAAKNFAEDLMPYMSIPRTWVIRDGVIIGEMIGGGGDQWADQIAQQLK